MSSTKVRNQSVERIANAEEKCGRAKANHARSPSTSGLRSKIPTNGGYRRGSGVKQESSRLPKTVGSDGVAVDKGSPIHSARRVSSKSATSATNSATTHGTKTSRSPGVNSAMAKRQLESQFATKRKRYATLKKELSERQKSAFDLYEEMSSLREKLLANGARDPGKIESINLSNIPESQSAPEHPGDGHALRGSGEQVFAPNLAVSCDLVASLEAKLRETPGLELCEELLKKRVELLLSLEESSRDSDGEGKIDLKIEERLEVCRTETQELEDRMKEARKSFEEVITGIIPKIFELWNEVEGSRLRISELENASEEIIKELRAKVDVALREKKVESEKVEELQERKVALKTELQKAKGKIRVLETRTNENEATIAQLQTSLKNAENAIKNKESGAEQRLREMQKSLKNSESLLVMAEKQRDNFELRLNELKRSSGLKESEAANRIKELTDKLEAVKIQLEERRAKQAKSEGANSEEDGDQLAERDERIERLEREKDDILKVVQHGLLSEGGGFMELENESHEALVSALMKKMQDVRTNIKLTQDKKENLQRQLVELRLRVQNQPKDTGSGGKSMWSSQVVELQQQVCDLRCSVAELTRQNEELEIQLNQKQLEIEERDRSMWEQSTVLKVRDEVITLLKGRPDARMPEGGHPLAVVKKKNSRDREQTDMHVLEQSEILNQLYTTLDTKQMQITRLEQLVKQMEIQQERSQEQRTRLEKRIAQLQMELYYKGKSHRYVVPENPPCSSGRACSAPTREGNPEVQSFCESRGAAPSPGRQFNISSANNSSGQPRSCSKPPAASQARFPPVQRSKTLNSIQIKSSRAGKEYAAQVVDEVARTLRRERAYDWKKRAREERRVSRKDRGFRPDDVAVEAETVSKEEFHESLYNWLVQPWMLEGSLHPAGLCQNVWPRECTASSEISISQLEREDDRGPRAPGDRSRESRSPGRRRHSEWNASPARARTGIQENTEARRRKKRS